MTYQIKYKERVYCSHCQTNYEKSDCPLYTTKTPTPVTYPVCPECIGNYRIRTSPKLKEWVKRRRKERKNQNSKIKLPLLFFMENNHNVYECRDKFLSLNPDLQIKSTLIHKSKFYNNDIGGYKLFNPTTLVTFYLIHFIESEPEWKLLTGYNKNFDSNAFFIPKKFVDAAAKETGLTVIVFLINNIQFYILPQQLQSFYRRNELEIKPNNEVIIPVPIKLLRTEFPLHPKV